MIAKAHKRLIVNADDYGLDQAACDAILDLSEKKLISSTSIMSNMATDEQINSISRQKNISTGWHINIVEGRSVSDPEKVSSLLNDKGEFLGSKALLLKFLSGIVKKAHIRTEIMAQYDKLMKAGINISHADAHQHTHQLAFIGPIILREIKELGIEKVRFGEISDRCFFQDEIIAILSKDE